MEDTFELLKDCNIKLDSLKTKDYRFVAWIIYSTLHDSFIAGVDTYSNDDENQQIVILKGIHRYPGEAIMQIHEVISKWHNDGSIMLHFPSNILSIFDITPTPNTHQ